MCVTGYMFVCECAGVSAYYKVYEKGGERDCMCACVRVRVRVCACGCIGVYVCVCVVVVVASAGAFGV